MSTPAMPLRVGSDGSLATAPENCGYPMATSSKPSPLKSNPRGPRVGWPTRASDSSMASTDNTAENGWWYGRMGSSVPHGEPSGFDPMHSGSSAGQPVSGHWSQIRHD